MAKLLDKKILYLFTFIGLAIWLASIMPAINDIIVASNNASNSKELIRGAVVLITLRSMLFGSVLTIMFITYMKAKKMHQKGLGDLPTSELIKEFKLSGKSKFFLAVAVLLVFELLYLFLKNF